MDITYTLHVTLHTGMKLDATIEPCPDAPYYEARIVVRTGTIEPVLGVLTHKGHRANEVLLFDDPVDATAACERVFRLLALGIPPEEVISWHWEQTDPAPDPAPLSTDDEATLRALGYRRPGGLRAWAAGR